MSSLVLSGDVSGTVTLAAPSAAGNTTLTLPTTSGTLVTTASGQTLTSPVFAGTPTGVGVLTSGTAVAASGSSVNFTSIPNWVKRITVMFNGVSTNGTSNPLIQIGSGSIQTNGYSAGSRESGSQAVYMNGFGIFSGAAVNLLYGHIVITNITANSWVATHNIYLNQTTAYSVVGGGSVTLVGILDTLRITTVNGVDIFDAGIINILYE